MKLYYSPTSPYARKCRALIIEKGLEREIELVECMPLEDPGDLHAINPLGKVPALERAVAPALMDSPLICEYLDGLTGEPWIPTEGQPRIRVLRQQALADGLVDLTIGRRIERMRDEPLQWAYWAGRWEKGIERTLERLDAERAELEGAVDLGALAVAVALSYLDLRYAELDWRGRHPGLDAFAKRWGARDSFARTAPPPA